MSEGPAAVESGDAAVEPESAIVDASTGAETTAAGEDAVPAAAEARSSSRTWVNPNVPGYVPPPRAATRGEADYALVEARPSFARAIFGSVVILTEELADWASLEGEEGLPRQTMEAAVRQAAEQQRTLERKPLADLRYATIGLAGDALDAAQNGAGRISGVTDAAARTAGKIFSPIWNSFLLAPFHEPVRRMEQAGETRVERWVRRGRVEEVRSRALAEVGLTNFVEESVSDITANPQVQMIIQQVIASQSTSMIAEIIKEIRERFVSLDLIISGKMGKSMVAAPEFRAQYLHEMAQRRPQFQRLQLDASLAGTYAGPVSRLLAFVVDLLVLIIAAGLVSSFISSTLSLFGLTDAVISYLTSGRTIATIILVILSLLNFIFVAAYFILSWNLIGATIGDALFGLRVVSKEGSRVSFPRAIARLAGMVVAAIPLFFGFIWALFDGRRQGWHDKLGGTLVLYDWPAEPDENFLHAQVTAELQERRGR